MVRTYGLGARTQSFRQFFRMAVATRAGLWRAVYIVLVTTMSKTATAKAMALTKMGMSFPEQVT